MTLGNAAFRHAVRRALAMQKVEGIAGPLRLRANGFPSTQWYAWEIFDDSTGSTYLVQRGSTLQDYFDPHSKRCELN